MKPTAPLAYLSAIAVLSLGCGGGEPMGRVSGVVTLDGQPLDRARVTFSHASGKYAYGETDGEGRYELQAPAGGDQLPIGEHTVQVTTAFTGRNEQGEMVDFPERVPPQPEAIRKQVVDGSQQIDVALVGGS